MSNGAREQLRGTVSRTDYWRTPTFNSSVSDSQHSADGLRETLSHPVSPTSSRDLPGRGCGHNQLHPVILRFLPSCMRELGKFQAYHAVISRRLPGIWKLCMREEPLLLLRLPGPTAESQEKPPCTVCTDFPQTDTAGSLQSTQILQAVCLQ
uniref:Uncharacterized protein n=1 Tax=Myotis myotis TaxID=51298 RepID=A0A7J7SRQ6_MYOMY|nr:hypothetical protein mMyoMyo1_009404 [Myotis myotis]